MTDMIESERQLDALIDASQDNRTVSDAVLPPLTEAERDAAIRKVSADVEAIGRHAEKKESIARILGTAMLFDEKGRFDSLRADVAKEWLEVVSSAIVRELFGAVHTVDEDFDHFLSYSGLRSQPPETIALLRRAFEAGCNG